jgi:hypothetical protein
MRHASHARSTCRLLGFGSASSWPSSVDVEKVANMILSYRKFEEKKVGLDCYKNASTYPELVSITSQSSVSVYVIAKNGIVDNCPTYCPPVQSESLSTSIDS